MFLCTACDLRVAESAPEWEFLERYAMCPRCKGPAKGFQPQEDWDKPAVSTTRREKQRKAGITSENLKEIALGRRALNISVLFEFLTIPAVGIIIFLMGIVDREGRYLENLQLEPDIVVPNEPGVVSAGRDQQLERAVEELMKELQSR